MGVLDGQRVNQSVTNPAFINKNQDDIMPNVLGFTCPTEGADVASIQAFANKIYDATGASESTTGTVYGAPAGTIDDGDSYQTAFTKIADKFDAATGHMHTGAAGDAPPISAGDISGAPLLGYINSGTPLSSITGTSTDVSSQLSGKSVSSSSSTPGIPVVSPYNKVRILNAGTFPYHDYVDDFGNVVYGRLTYAASVWTLSFYSMATGVETAYSMTSQSLFWFYQELYNPLQSPPVYLQNMTMMEAYKPEALSQLADVDISAPAVGETLQYDGSKWVNTFGGGGGGGGSLQWVENANAPIPTFENNIEVYVFDAGLGQNLFATIKVPDSYAAGNPIAMNSLVYSSDTTGNLLFQTIATLIRTGTDAISSTTNQRTSTNSAISLGAGTVNKPQAVSFDLTSSIGQINGVDVSPGDLIIVELLRGTDTSTVAARAMVFACELTFT